MPTSEWAEELLKIPKEDLDPQDEWKQLFFNLKTEDKSYSQTDREAINYVICELEKLIEHLKKGSWPTIYGIKLPEDGVKNKNVMMRYEIILSHPWGG